jgi:hypothetical protein
MKLILPIVFGAALCGPALAQRAATAITLSVEHPTGIANNGPGYYKCGDPAPGATFVVCQKIVDATSPLSADGRLLAHCVTSKDEEARKQCTGTAPGSVCLIEEYFQAHCDNPPESKP